MQADKQLEARFVPSFPVQTVSFRKPRDITHHMPSRKNSRMYVLEINRAYVLNLLQKERLFPKK